MPIAKKARPAQAEPTKIADAKGPFYFLSFSTGEPHVELFVECLEIVFKNHFELKRTPSALEVGESQHDKILRLIQDCAFGVVCLDGLRPNVVFEYGALRGADKHILVFKEAQAKVDIGHFFASAPDLALKPPAIDIDKHFSDTKDRYYGKWNRFEIQSTVNAIWKAYTDWKTTLSGYMDIPEPRI